MKKILHIINSTVDFNQVNSNSKLLDSVDTELLHDEYHTSLGELTPNQILKISNNFDTVLLERQGFDTESDIFKESSLLVDYLSNSRQLPDTFTDHQRIKRKSESSVLWVFGCSHSAGIGLVSEDQKYGEILSIELGLPLNLVALPGSSVNWSFRQLFNAPINTGDVVVWQLTSPNRTTICTGNGPTEVQLSRTSDRHLLEVLTDDQLYFNQMMLLNAGVKYLRSLGNKFVLISIEPNIYTYRYRSQYIRYPEYCYMPNPILDLGTDNSHMGPLSHQALAQCILNHVNCNND